MSIWTNNRRRRFPTLLAALALAGCVAPELAGRAAPGSVAVLDRSVMVAGPRGYCIDSAASRNTATTAFVLLGSCASLSGSSRVTGPASSAILTASVIESSADITEQTDRLATFFRSGAGRAALSRSGEAASVEVRESFGKDGVFFIRVSDVAADDGTPVEPEYWRAILSVNGRLVTLTVLGHRARPQPPETKRALLEAFIARMLAANPAAAKPAQT